MQAPPSLTSTVPPPNPPRLRGFDPTKSAKEILGETDESRRMIRLTNKTNREYFSREDIIHSARASIEGAGISPDEIFTSLANGPQGPYSVVCTEAAAEELIAEGTLTLVHAKGDAKMTEFTCEILDHEGRTIQNVEKYKAAQARRAETRAQRDKDPANSIRMFVDFPEIYIKRTMPSWLSPSPYTRTSLLQF